VHSIIAVTLATVVCCGFYLQARICIQEGERRERRRLALLPLDESRGVLLSEWARLKAEGR